jgi:cation:H+ antiporter
MEFILSLILFIAGLAILIKGSDFFVGGAAYVARRFGVSKLIIGLTLVSLGTSLPELGASVYASYTGESGIAVGNVVGSNIANIALVLGACLLLKRITVNSVKNDALIMLGVSFVFTFFVLSGIARWEGFVLMVIFVAYLTFLYRKNKVEKRNNKKNNTKNVKNNPDTKKGALGKEVALLVLGCVGVVAGAKLMVDSAVYISYDLGISGAVIGSTLVAFGTSVPELAVSLAAILKKQEDISIGNIVGSNIFNILLVIGASAMVSSLTVDNILLYTNIPIMLTVAGLLTLFMLAGKKLQRWQGGLFVAIYVAFLILNFW